MNAQAIAMPRLGMTMEEGTVIAWPLALGTSFQRGDVILVIETEKAESEIEASASGVMRHIYVEVGETVPCGALLAAMTDSSEQAFDPETFAASYQPPDAVEEDEAGEAPPTSVRPEETRSRTSVGERKAIAPAARALAKKLGVDPNALEGTGPKGRVTKADVEAYATLRQNLTEVAPGVGLEVLREGTGDPVVLLPGFGTDLAGFALQTPDLAQRFEVIGVNPRGVGQSDAPPDALYSVTQTAEDVAQILDAPAHVIGASLGAAAALTLALNHPEKVCSLTLLTPFLHVTPRLQTFARAWERARREASVEGVAEILAPWLFGDAVLGDETARARMLRGLAQTINRTSAEVLARQAQGLIEWSGPSDQDLKNLSLPILILAGGADILTPDADSVAAVLPQARFEVLDGCGHALSTDGGQQVTELILNQLEALTTAGNPT